jgi:hypothetical protein
MLSWIRRVWVGGACAASCAIGGTHGSLGVQTERILFMSRVLYIDYENVQNVDLNRIAHLDFKVWLFAGVSQSRIPIELVRSTQAFGNKLEWVSIDGNGPNALDFHIAYYLGAHAANNSKDEYFILSKDKGFDPLIKHVAKLKVKCRRISTISEIEPTQRATAKTKRAPDSDGVYGKIVENLSKIAETKRPRNRKTLRGHVKTIIGKTQTDEKIDEIISRLFASRVVLEADGGLAYRL